MSRRLMDPMKRGPFDDKPAEFPFDWIPSHSTDVKATFDRLCPGWRDRKPSDEQEPPKVALITQQTRRRK